MNTSNMALEDESSVVTSISLMFRVISMNYRVEEDASKEGECEECSKSSTWKWLFFVL